MRTTKRTIAIDFDGVIHDYLDGWRDGEIYGLLTSGAVEAIEVLLKRNYAVFIHSSKHSQQILECLKRQETWTFPTEIIAPDRRFWDIPDIVGITDRKVPAFIYVDDRAYKFDTTTQSPIFCWLELTNLFH